MKLLGIDDAGRGPVLGPMILAGVLIEESEEQKIKELGAKDSKLLTPLKRNQLKNQFISYPHHIEISEPQQIDAHPNLNKLEAEKAAKIINTLVKEKTRVIVDCPSSNPVEWQDKLVAEINPEIIHLVEISCEHKADFNHPIVSAASIIAKEKREEEVARLKKEYREDFGSGYPSDPKTKEFVKKNHSNPEFEKLIRHSWSTVKKLKGNKDQKKLF
jgi:ribonuclease HII